MKALDRTHILARIVEAKRSRLQVARMRVPEAIIRQMAKVAGPSPSFREALEAPRRVRLIAEVKKVSPSKGVLQAELDVEQLTTTYAESGASAISVVTEEDFFQGDLAWVGRIRKVTNLPILRKDFIFESYQVYETRASGAGAILLIVAMLTPAELKALIAAAHEYKLDAVVEVHDETELGEALEAGAMIIGVNNRDLKSFNVNLETSFRLARLIPDDRLFIVESGIHSKNDVDRLLDAGADAFLIGEHFLTAPDPAAAIRGLL